eukprot:TRINITY_DN7659_c0_g1_i1.p1 TRINITY_DN7659_c0_g1~~TRINITY_DN7659_c0_g1_i1.p1  ORF type:complete len:560 (-),score=113.59 TRINITY_DN7659_c0_g1_i1:63-1742(-)
MDCVQSIHNYVTEMVQITDGMKVLLMDRETTGIVSMVYSQSEMLQKEVYLFECIDTENRENMAHLKAICFLRPTEENIHLLKNELRRPKYGEYYLFFSNTLSVEYLKILAAADEHTVVQEVIEYYADYYAVNKDTWTLNMRDCISSKSDFWPDQLDRIVQGIFSNILSLRVRPYIRYQRSSDCASIIAQELSDRINIASRSLFQWKNNVAPLLLILDRRDDPVTPLLTPWTYQAMIHEHIGIDNNLVDMTEINPNIPEELEKMVMSPSQDEFYKENMFKDFGDLGVAIKEIADKYQKDHHMHQDISDIAEIKRFIENYQDYKTLGTQVNKHVSVMESLKNKLVEDELLRVSAIQQTVACEQGQKKHLAQINDLFSDYRGDPTLLLRLVMLYNLRYEDNPIGMTEFKEQLLASGLSVEKISILRSIKGYAGANKRSREVDLFQNNDILSIARGSIKRGLMGVTNIYTQHESLLLRILRDSVKGKLSESTYPFTQGVPQKERPQKIILFVFGGITYEEAQEIASFNQGNRNTSVVLGGTFIHNSKTFLEDMMEARRRSKRM